jgi:nitroreductase/NAD-dependent dihydropyrimidine dehydrogenase PreA subunit
MITLEINKQKCKGDGRCIEVCPMRILQMNTGQKIPEFVPGGGDMCINCGHCFALCPYGAINLSTMNVDQSMPFDASALPNAKQVEMFLKGRRSIRIYKDTPVSTESVEKLLDIARYAPSGINRQPVSWSAVMGKDRVHDLGGLVSKWMEELLQSKNPMATAYKFDHIVESWKQGKDRICRGAPCILIAYGHKDDPMVPQSCTIAGTYLELAAFGQGFGACWAGYVNIAVNMSLEIRTFVGLPASATAGAAMMIGYAGCRYARIPSRNPARIIWK